MKRKESNSKLNLIGMFILSLCVLLGLTKNSFPAQFDAPYSELEKKYGTEWAKEDKAIDAKLAALEKKFGKKPNIIYILTDDIGYGELGVQGGGAMRGMHHASDRSHGARGNATQRLLFRAFLYADPHCFDDWTTSRSHRSDRCHLSGQSSWLGS